jgi:hypothetical protein
MRTIMTALAASALIVLPFDAGATTPSAAPEQTKPETQAAEATDAQASPTASAEPTAASTKKPVEQSAAEIGARAEPKPDQSAQAEANEGDVPPAES